MAIDAAGRLVTDGWTVEAPLAEWVAELGGRFVVIDALSSSPRLHVDPLASLGVVFRRDARIAGSTTGLVASQTPQLAPPRAPQPLGPNQFHPAGLTSQDGVRRVLPNHALALDTWSCARTTASIIPRIDPSERSSTIEAIGRRMRQLLTAAACDGPLISGLTAGRDSRVILACGRPLLAKNDDRPSSTPSVSARLSFFTFYDHSEPASTDAKRAVDLAGRFGLQHRLIPCRDPRPEERHTYCERIGHDGHWGKARDFWLAAGRSLPADAALVVGFGGEVGRGFYWHRNLTSGARSRPLDAKQLLRFMKLSTEAQAVTAMHAWIDRAPYRDDDELLDRVYLEHRVGAWASPHLYGVAPFRLVFTPFCDLGVLEAMRSLPIDDRLADRVPADVIESLWPELLQIAFDRAPALVRGARAARRLGRRLRGDRS